MSNIKIIFTVAALSLSAGANAGNLFTCKLPGNKVASVSIDGAQIYYSYGKEGAQPDVQLDRTQNWFMGNNHYAGANYQLTFRVQKGDYNYVLYSQNYGDKLDEGLVAYNGTKFLFNKKCTEAAKVDDSVWSAQPVDFGMQEETDQTSDMVANIKTGDVATVPTAQPEPEQSTSMADNAPKDNTGGTYGPSTEAIANSKIDGSHMTPNEYAAAYGAKMKAQHDIYLAKRAKAASAEQGAIDAVPQIAPPSDGSSPVAIQLAHTNTGNTIIRVTSTVDNLTIMGIKINRGNCTTIGDKTINGVSKMYSLKYGQYVDYQYMSNCNVLEVSVDTNIGYWISRP